jgi:hypothetical protein
MIELLLMVSQGNDDYQVASALMLAVPRVGEHLSVSMSSPYSTANPINGAHFLVKSVTYHLLNTTPVQGWMNPYRGMESTMVEVIVEPLDEQTTAYVQRVIQEQSEQAL